MRLIKHLNDHNYFIIIPFFLVLFFIGFPAQAENQAGSKNILLLFPFSETRDWDNDFSTGFFSTIKISDYPELSISLEYLRTGLIPDKISATETITKLKRINESYPPDIIVSIFPSVHTMIAEFGEEIFPGIPKIFVPVTGEQSIELQQIKKSFVIKSSSEYAIRTTLLNIKTLMPESKDLIVISGSGNDDIYYMNFFNWIINSQNTDFNLTYYVGEKLEDLILRLSNLNDNTAIFYLPINKDNYGNTYKTSSIFPKLAEAADAPIFTFFDTAYGQGITGGVMTSALSYGKETAETALKILKNQTGQIDTASLIFTEKYDFRQLQRWGIDEDLVPAGSEITHKTETFLEKYLLQILLVLLLTTGETLLLIILFINLKKRHKAEQQLRKSEELLDRSQSTAQVGGWDFNIESDEFFYTKEMLSILEIESSAFVAFENMTSSCLPEDREELNEILEHAFNNNQVFEHEFRILTAEGKIKWIYIRGKAVKENGKTIRMFGTLQNITRRKKSELEIQHSLNEKDVLLKEVHHRVKNNLAIISSLIALQRNTIDDIAVGNILLSSQNRIDSMALIHEHLYLEGNLLTIDIYKYVERLVSNIISDYAELRNVITVNLDLMEKTMEIDTLVPIGIILNEIVSNSLTHAFIDIEKPCIEINLQQAKDGSMVLSIKDNGIGLPDKSVLSKKETIGFLLIENLVEQINGRLEISRENGTSLKIIFKDE